MDYRYLVTSKTAHVPEDRSPHSLPEIMLGDPGDWKYKTGDYLINNRRAGGADVLILEVSEKTNIPNKATFVTHEINAGVCATAAWLQLLKMVHQGGLAAGVAEIHQSKLRMICYQAEAYAVPDENSGSYGKNWIFARAVEASFYMEADRIRAELGLAKNINHWSIGQKSVLFSSLFERFTRRLIDACFGITGWPGDNGEAAPCLDRYRLADSSFADRMYAIDGVAILDARGYGGAINARHLVEWARDSAPSCKMTLTVQDRSLNLIESEAGLNYIRFNGELLLADPLNSHHLQIPAFSYKLGYIPLLREGPGYSDRGVWDELTRREEIKRAALRMPPAIMGWREIGNYSGFSSPIDGYTLTVPEVTAIMRHHNSV